MTAGLADTALRMTIVRRRPSGTVIVHSDRGGQFRSRRYQRTLRVHGLQGCMGRVASAGDNAAMDSFFSLLQKNVLNRQPWNDRHQLRSAIITWIESTYNHRRRQRARASSPRQSSKRSSAATPSQSQHEHANPLFTKVWPDPPASLERTVLGREATEEPGTRPRDRPASDRGWVGVPAVLGA
jgi:hypothetical protein